MAALGILLTLLLTGYAWGRMTSERFSSAMSLRLNRYVVYIALPALVLRYVPGIDTGSAMLLVLSAWGIFLLSSAAVLLLGALLEWKREITGALLFTVPYGNTSFLGVPFTQAFFGKDALAYPLIYDQLGSFLILSTLGLATLAFYSAESFSPEKMLKKMLLFPSFLALIFALLSPEAARWIGEIGGVGILADSLAPAAMLAIGLQLRLRFEPHERLPFYLAMGLKLIAAPLLLLLLFSATGLETTAAKVSVFEAGMAPMVTSSTMAMLAGLAPRFVASILGYGIILSFVTVPLLYGLIEQILG